jgi:hypothetical protein
LHNIQQQTTKCFEVYYDCVLKLANCLHVRTTNVFFTIVFRISLLPCFILTSMKKDTLIEHKEADVVCEENRLISLSHNVLLTTLEAYTITKLVIG